MKQMNLLTNRKKLTDKAKELTVAGGEGIGREFGIDMNTLLYLKWITDEDRNNLNGKRV